MELVDSNPAATETAPVLRRVAQAGALTAAALGLAALLGWALDLPLLSSPERHWIPMAPSTALLFALLGAALFLGASMPDRRAVLRTATGIAVVVAAVALLLLIVSSAGIRSPLELLGFSIAGGIDGAQSGPQIGYMSPVTAAWFLLAAASAVAAFCASGPGAPRRAMAAFWLACVAGAAGTFFLLAYVFGKPLLYGGDFIPPAFSTSLAFVALGLALAALAAPRAWQFEGAIDAASRRYARFLVFVFALVAAGMVATGYLYVSNHEQQYRVLAGRELSAIAELKVQDLARWREERLAEVAVSFGNEVFADLVRRAFNGPVGPAGPRDRQAHEQLQGWLQQARAAHRYEHIFLSDAQGVARMSVPPQALSAGAAAHARDTAGLKQAVFLDFHRDGAEDAVHLSILVPILDRNNGGKPLGALFLAIDPEQLLYPFIQRWPAPSRSAETLLVRRDGEDALFLNELRFQKHTALSLRIPLARTDVAAVKAVLGQEGVVDALDYRGVPVIASLRKVPDSPWFLVARMDAAEAMAPAYANLWLVTGLVGALLLAAAGAVGAAWRHRRVRHYQQRLRAADALAASLARHRAVTQSATDAIVTADAQGRIVAWNPAAARIFGYAEAEVLGELVAKLMPERYRERHRSGMARVSGGGEPRVLFKTVELHGLTAAGIEFPLEMSLSQWNTADSVFFTSIMRDITERRHAQTALARRNDLYNLLSQTNQSIVRIASREELFPKVCRNAVEYGHFLFAWIGAMDAGAPNARVQPAAWFGEDQGYVEAIRAAALKSDPAGWSGPIGQALRAGEHMIGNDFLNDAAAAPWHAAARRAGVRAAAAFPIREDGAVVGVMCLYSGECGYFTEDLLLTLDEMALDVSFALTVYAREAERSRAQEDLRAAQQVGRLGSYVLDIPGDAWRSSEMLDTIFGIGPEYPRSAAGWAQLVHAAERGPMLAYLGEIIATHRDFDREYRIVRANDGAARWVWGMGRVEYGADGAALRCAWWAPYRMSPSAGARRRR